MSPTDAYHCSGLLPSYRLTPGNGPSVSQCQMAGPWERVRRIARSTFPRHHSSAADTISIDHVAAARVGYLTATVNLDRRRVINITEAELAAHRVPQR